jgi:hypothetical protein
VELQTQGFVDYVRRLDTEQNERLQEEEYEIIRLWKARNSVLSQLESSKQIISSPLDDNLSVSEVESRYDENESIISQQTDYPKVKNKFNFRRKKNFVFKLIPKDDSKSPRFIFSTRLRSTQSSITPTSSFVNRNTANRNGNISSVTSPDQYDDRSSGVGSLIPSPVHSPVVSVFDFCERILIEII